MKLYRLADVDGNIISPPLDPIALATKVLGEAPEASPEGHDFAVRCAFCLDEPFDVADVNGTCWERHPGMDEDRRGSD